MFGDDWRLLCEKGHGGGGVRTGEVAGLVGDGFGVELRVVVSSQALLLLLQLLFAKHIVRGRDVSIL